ncbi:hypothetical protein SAMN05421738_1099 [Algoriella xinjiangensis]|uniref:Uncharacterized protein n=1 Tax=Algoriella xinjiangensis TaxID=684065 RepID=A0A1I4XH50_9FLAO|nr:hypothetical protein [Algoriella xinjiangensis]SFN24823.1 hypothetical protein SAMN05421738_1099 [Algoriella xinjiangensis]VDH17626.1 Uncharacterised protein [Algoriella xinjiangensis]
MNLNKTDSFSDSFFLQLIIYVNNQFYETKKNNWDENHNIYYTYDFADYDRKKYGLNINYSPVFTLFKGVTLMPKAGIGIKHRNINYSNSVNLQEAENASWGWMYHSLYR